MSSKFHLAIIYLILVIYNTVNANEITIDSSQNELKTPLNTTNLFQPTSTATTLTKTTLSLSSTSPSPSSLPSTSQFIDNDFFTRSFQLPRIKYRKLNHTDEPQQIASLLQMAANFINTVFVPFDEFEPFLVTMFNPTAKINNPNNKSNTSTNLNETNTMETTANENLTASSSQFNFSDFTSVQSSYFACLVIGIIYAVGVPAVSLIICISRVYFHKCGGLPMQDVSVSRSFWRYANCVIQAFCFKKYFANYHILSYVRRKRVGYPNLSFISSFFVPGL